MIVFRDRARAGVRLRVRERAQQVAAPGRWEGKPSAVDRARFHGIARGSAMECGALLDVCAVAGHVEPALAREGKELVVRVVAMLSKMCRR